MNEKWEKRAEKFRKAYETSEEADVIPSLKDFGIISKRETEFVGPYCRVSTKQESQTESYELQKKYYEEYVNRYPSWTLVDIYADPGISATSMRNRKDLNRLIEDCKAGIVTKIITKSVSRFARNVVDAISTVRMLRALPKPVGVYFETEHIDTLSRESDSQLSLLASFAESESLTRSTSMKWAIRSRFARYIPRVCDAYGYIKQRNDWNLYLNPLQAPIVDYIFSLFLDGFSPGQIARHLTELKIATPTGKSPTWYPAVVFYILSNEKNCGDIRMQKTISVDVFTHKSVPNMGEERSYVKRDHHHGIVSREEWEHVQAMLGTYFLIEFFAVGENATMEIGGETYHILNAKKGLIL